MLRTVKLKLLIPDDENGKETRAALWNTHAILNRGISYYLDYLIMIRQEPIPSVTGSTLFNRNTPCTGERCRQLIDKHLENIRKNQNQPGLTQEEKSDIYEILRALYGELILITEKDPGEQKSSAKKIFSSLVQLDLDSLLGKNQNNTCLADLPLSQLQILPPEEFIGKKPASLREFKAAQTAGTLEEWKTQKIEKLRGPLTKMAKKGLIPFIEPFTNTIPLKNNTGYSLRDIDMFLHALEILASWEKLTKQFEEEYRKTKSQLDAFKETHNLDNPENLPPWFTTLKLYEQTRKSEIEASSIEPETDFKILPHTTRGWTQLHSSWKTLTPEERTEENLRELFKISKSYRRKSGNYNESWKLFKKLITSEYRHVWEHEDYLRIFVHYNRLLQQHELTSQPVTLTYPHPKQKPQWQRCESRGGTSLKNYEVATERTGLNTLTLPLLYTREDNSIHDEMTSFTLVPSDTWGHFTVHPYKLDRVHTTKNSGQKIEYTDPRTKTRFSGTTGDARITFTPSYIRWLKEEALAAGEIGPVWVSLSLKLKPSPDPSPREETTHEEKPHEYFNNPKKIKHLENALTYQYDPALGIHCACNFNSARDKDYTRTTIEELILQSTEAELTGLSSLAGSSLVLAVHLNPKTFASCSVFELTAETPPPEKLAFPIKNTGLFALHRRSFHLQLPGENPPLLIQLYRKAVESDRKLMKIALKCLKTLISLEKITNPKERADKLHSLYYKEINENISNSDVLTGLTSPPLDKIINPQLLADLWYLVQDNSDAWKRKIQTIRTEWEKSLRTTFNLWRKKGKYNPVRDHFQAIMIKPGERGRPETTEKPALGGLSTWHIREIARTRKLINNWNAFLEKHGTIQETPKLSRFRRDPETREQDFDRRLSEKIADVREERIFKGTEQILMSALGYVFEKTPENLAGEWIPRYPACRIILFADSDTNRFAASQLPGENSPLMQRIYRESIRAISSSVEPYNLITAETPGEFANRFYAHTGTPGIRCKRVTPDDLAQNSFKTALVRELGSHRIKTDEKGRLIIKVGDHDWIIKEGDVIPCETGPILVTRAKNDPENLEAVDESVNAAHNLVARFWGRNTPPYRITAIEHTIEDKKIYIPLYTHRPHNPEKSTLTLQEEHQTILNSYLTPKPDKSLKLITPDENSPIRKTIKEIQSDWTKAHSAPFLTYQTKPSPPPIIKKELIEDLEDLANCTIFFRDPSSILLPENLWFQSDIYWETIKSKLLPLLYHLNRKKR